MRPTRGRFATLAALVVFATFGATGQRRSAPPAVRQVPSARARFAKHDRARLAWLIAKGRPTASLLIAYSPGRGDTLVRRLGELGGRIQYRADTVGYLRVDIPVAHVVDVTALQNIDAININGTQAYGVSVTAPPGGASAPQGASEHDGDTTARRHQATRWRVAPPDASTPPENPYLPMRDVGAPQFVRVHPTFDGRGVTIGSIECCVDFWHPVFQEPALTLDGKPTRKIAALYTVVAADSEATNRAHTRDWVDAVNSALTYDGVHYRAPRDGRFRIGYYAGPTGFKKRANWRSDTLDVSTRRAVLLDPRSGEVWLDGLDDHDFTHDAPVRDYNATGDVGVMGRDDPATPWDDRLTFAVGIDTADTTVDVYPGDGAHITAVAGIAVGAHVYGGRATGAAPRARVVLVSEGGGWKGMESHQSSRIESMLLLARRPDVDVITSQEWYDMRLKDGGSVWSLVADRVVATYHKAVFQGIGNEGPGLGTGDEAFNGQRAMRVGGSIDQATWYSSFALLADHKDYVFGVSSRGPDAAGGASPDFVAPMVQLMAQPVGTSGDPGIRNNVGFFSPKIIYRNPPGYTLQFGTSYATPTAAGVSALLISAARQTGIPVDPERLRWALSGGARHLPGYQTYEQGAGLLNATAAWDRLQRAPEPVDITVEAPVRSVMSPYLTTPGHGRGLYEREGWVTGDSATRQVTFTRTSGPADVVTYLLRWRGNDGTFASEPSVTLGLNRPVSVPVVVHPRTWGAHSALLQLLSADGVTSAQQMSAVVVAAHPLDAAHQYEFVTVGRVAWLGTTSYFVSVPAGAGGLDLALTIGHGATRMVVCDPSGHTYPSMVPEVRGRRYDWPNDVAIGVTQQQSAGVLRRTIEQPEPGVWEVVVEHEGSATPELRLKRQSPATFTFSATVTRVTGVTSTPALPAARTDRPSGPDAHIQLTLRNELAPVTARVIGGALASADRETLSLRQDGPTILRELVIDSGTTRLGVRLAHPSDPAADIDVHVFDCTSGHCEPYVAAVFQGAEKEVRVQQPQPGRWRIVVDPYLVPSGATTVEYRDEVVNPKYGTVTVVEPRIELPVSGTATVTVNLTPGMTPESGRIRGLRLEVESLDDQTPSGPPEQHGTAYPRGVLSVIHVDCDNH